MTHLDIDKLEAGPELDALIAVLVMGWQRWNTWIDQAQTIPVVKFIVQGSLGSRSAPLFSTDIAAAWLVVEHMLLSYESFVLKRVLFKDASELFSPQGLQKHINRQWSAKFGGANESEARTAPLAICRAAYKAVMWQDA